MYTKWPLGFLLRPAVMVTCEDIAAAGPRVVLASVRPMLQNSGILRTQSVVCGKGETMATIGDLYCGKHLPHGFHGVISVAPNDTVLEATRVMNAHGIGSVLVMEGMRPVGIFTERDVLRRIVATCCRPEETLLRDVMTTDLVCCSVEDAVDHVADTMRSQRIRHLPVIDAEGYVVGMVSIGDINAFRSAEVQMALHQIESYVYSRN